MKFSFKALVLVLVLQVTAGSVTVHAELWPSAENQQPAGCHGHSHDAPQPKPKTFACCLAGHESALLQASASIVPACDVHVRVAATENYTPIANHSRESIEQIISSAGPPARLPLRI
jgi:hypothetical protein